MDNSKNKRGVPMKAMLFRFHKLALVYGEFKHG
jgi:hypothetical protein